MRLVKTQAIRQLSRKTNKSTKSIFHKMLYYNNNNIEVYNLVYCIIVNKSHFYIQL